MANRNENDGRSLGADRQEGANAASSQGGSRRSNRGFASMDPSKQREIASKGGKAAHAKGTAHEFDSGEAREAGRKGGIAVSRNREHMAAIGRRGGEARGQARNRSNSQVNSQGAGGTAPGAAQNSGAMRDREVGISGRQGGASVNTQGTQGGNTSLGGERRTTNNVAGESESSTRNDRESYGNH